MDASVKHRIIGSILVIAIALIISPFFIKETKPYWIVLEDSKSFKIPPTPKPIEVSTYKPKEVYSAQVKEIAITDNVEVIEGTVKNAQLEFNTQQSDLKETNQLAVLKQTEQPTVVIAKAESPKLKGNKNKLVKSKSEVKQTYYSLQLATFSSSKLANRLLDKLKKQGVDAYLNPFTTKSGKKYTKVMAGRLTDKQQMKRLQEKLNKAVNVNSIIVKLS